MVDVWEAAPEAFGLAAIQASVVEARAHVLLMTELVALEALLVSHGSLLSVARRPFRGFLLRVRFGFWRWLRQLFDCCYEGSGCRFRC